MVKDKWLYKFDPENEESVEEALRFAGQAKRVVGNACRVHHSTLVIGDAVRQEGQRLLIIHLILGVAAGGVVPVVVVPRGVIPVL